MCADDKLKFPLKLKRKLFLVCSQSNAKEKNRLDFYRYRLLRNAHKLRDKRIPKLRFSFGAGTWQYHHKHNWKQTKQWKNFQNHKRRSRQCSWTIKERSIALTESLISSHDSAQPFCSDLLKQNGIYFHFVNCYCKPNNFKQNSD